VVVDEKPARENAVTAIVAEIDVILLDAFPPCTAFAELRRRTTVDASSGLRTGADVRLGSLVDGGHSAFQA